MDQKMIKLLEKIEFNTREMNIKTDKLIIMIGKLVDKM